MPATFDNHIDGYNARIPTSKRLPSFQDSHSSLRCYSDPPSRYVRLRYVLTLLPITRALGPAHLAATMNSIIHCKRIAYGAARPEMYHLVRSNRSQGKKREQNGMIKHSIAYSIKCRSIQKLISKVSRSLTRGKQGLPRPGVQEANPNKSGTRPHLPLLRSLRAFFCCSNAQLSLLARRRRRQHAAVKY